MFHRLLFCLAFLLVLPAVSFADDKEDSKKYYEEGKAKYDSGDLDGAIALLDKAFELDNRNFKAQKLLAESLESKGKQLVAPSLSTRPWRLTQRRTSSGQITRQ